MGKGSRKKADKQAAVKPKAPPKRTRLYRTPRTPHEKATVADTQFEVEKILHVRWAHGRKEYLVQFRAATQRRTWLRSSGMTALT
jgi:hypothetical protein